MRSSCSLRFFFTGLALAVAGCSSSSDTGAAGTPGAAASGSSADCKTGKNAAFATPAGTPFQLPAGVKLTGEITGDFEPDCGLLSSPVEYGGDALIVCMSLENTTGAEIKMTLPGGLFFFSANPATQHGLMLQDHELTLPPGKVTHFKINLFCANRHCKFGSKTDRFTLGVVSSDPRILELVGLARDKSLQEGDSDEAFLFGKAIWEVTDGDGLTADTRKQLEALPKK